MIALIILVIIAVILLIGIWIYMTNEIRRLEKKIRKLEWRIIHERNRKTKEG